MGKYKTIISSSISGNVGSMNFRRRGSTTVVAVRSFANSSKGDGASDIQRRHRSRMANVVSFFRAIKPTQPNAWQYGNAGASSYNRFFSVNLASSPIFLTIEEARLRSCVIAPYIVSSGSLRPLAQSCVDGIFHSGVVVSAGLDLDSCTLGEFSASIIANNYGWQNGDKFYMCCLDQSMKLVGGRDFPAVLTKFFSVILDTTSSRLFSSLANYSALELALADDGELICSSMHDAAFGIHSRIVAGDLLSSPQRVVMRSFEEPTYLLYSSSVQEERAMKSYGYQEPVLLTPNSEVMPPIRPQAIISSILFNEDIVSAGAVYEDEGILTILGENLSDDTLKVLKDDERLPLSYISPTQMVVSLTETAEYKIYANDVMIISFELKVHVRIDIPLVFDKLDGYFAILNTSLILRDSSDFSPYTRLDVSAFMGKRLYIECVSPRNGSVRSSGLVAVDGNFGSTDNIGVSVWTQTMMYEARDEDSVFRSSFIVDKPYLWISYYDSGVTKFSLYYYT